MPGDRLVNGGASLSERKVASQRSATREPIRTVKLSTTPSLAPVDPTKHDRLPDWSTSLRERVVAGSSPAGVIRRTSDDAVAQLAEHLNVSGHNFVGRQYNARLSVWSTWSCRFESSPAPLGQPRWRRPSRPLRKRSAGKKSSAHRFVECSLTLWPVQLTGRSTSTTYAREPEIPSAATWCKPGPTARRLCWKLRWFGRVFLKEGQAWPTSHYSRA